MRTYKSNLRNLFIFSIPAFLVGGGLIWFGCKQYPLLQHDPGGFPPGWTLYVLPWLVGGILVLGPFLIMMNHSNRRILVGRVYVEYYKGSQLIFKSSWSEVIFTAPNPERKSFRRALLSNGFKFADIEEFYFPEFAQLVETIEALRKKGNTWAA